MASENDTIAFVIIDAEKNPNSRKFADVIKFRTFASFRDGKLIDQIQTNKSESLKIFVHEATAN
tara:strand:- start:380 stop:571 length:192 start_codon:yes stop_codon:yes gene_type:complete